MAAKKCSEDHVEILYWTRSCPLCTALDGLMCVMDQIGFTDPDASKHKKPKRKPGKLIMFPKKGPKNV